MNIIQVARLIMTGLIKQIPEDTRYKLIKLVLEARKKPVTYTGATTICPVCDTFSLQGHISVYRTVKELRYCDCRRCGVQFVAIGEQFEKPASEHKFKRKKR